MKPLTALFQITILLSVAMAASLQSPTTPLRSSPIGVGDTAPDFTLEDHNKNHVTLSDARAARVSLCLFSIADTGDHSVPGSWPDYDRS